MQEAENTVPETDTEEVAEETTEVQEEPEAESSSTIEVDYEAEAETERKRAPDPEKAKEAFKKRQARRENGEEVVEDEDKPLTRKDLEHILATDRLGTQKDVRESNALTIARTFSKNEAEVQAILAKWRNRTFPQDMSLGDQIEEMYAAVNRKKILATNTELARALLSKQTASKDVATAQRDPAPGNAPKLPADLEGSLKRTGFAYDTKSRVWKKQLPNKSWLFKDPKSNRTWVAK